MTCLAMQRPEAASESLETLAGRLAASPVRLLERQAGGGNNRLYRVDTEDGRYALKCYDGDGSERLSREFDGLRFLAEAGIGTVPAALAIDRGNRAALYEWIDGSAVPRTAARPPGHIGAALAFTARLAVAGRDDGGERLPLAAEACLSARQLIGQIAARLDRLAGLGESPALADFLDAFRHVFGLADAGLHRLYAAAGILPEAEIAPERRTLSPSDFGFHNAMQRPEGALVFLDFEYFGWDDPVKLTADFLWHPAFALTPDDQGAWLTGQSRTFGSDPSYTVRLAAQMPLYGLRWCLILLNEFLPERWQRRVFAGTTDGWAEAKSRQLAKARLWLAEAARLASAPDAPIAAHLPLLMDR